MWTYLVIMVISVSAFLLLLLMIARFVQPEMIYALRHALVQVKTTKAFLDYYDNRPNRVKTFPDLLGDDLRFETRDSDEEDVLTRVDKIRELFRVQLLKHTVPGIREYGKPQVCIVELAGLLVNLGRKVKPDRKFRYPTVDADQLLQFICDEVRKKNGEPPLEDVSKVEEWLTANPISVEQVLEILIAAVFSLSYRQRVHVKALSERKAERDSEKKKDAVTRANRKSAESREGVKKPARRGEQPVPSLEPKPVLAAGAAAPRTVKVFISYSHKDAKYLRPKSLLGTLQGLEAEGVEFWSDQSIPGGTRWDDEIRSRVSQSDIALVLVSQAYLDSPYCLSTEIRMFLDEAEKRGLIIFPIMLSRCEAERHPWLNKQQFLPADGKNIEQHFATAKKRQPLFHEIRQHLRGHILEIRNRQAASGD